MLAVAELGEEERVIVGAHALTPTSFASTHVVERDSCRLISDPYPGTGHEIVGNRPVEGSFTDRSRLLHGRPTRGRPVRTPLSLSVLIPWMGGWVAKRAAAKNRKG